MLRATRPHAGLSFIIWQHLWLVIPVHELACSYALFRTDPSVRVTCRPHPPSASERQLVEDLGYKIISRLERGLVVMCPALAGALCMAHWQQGRTSSMTALAVTDIIYHPCFRCLFPSTLASNAPNPPTPKLTQRYLA